MKTPVARSPMGGPRPRRAVRFWLPCMLLGLLLAVPQSNWAMSLADVIELSRAGYSDEQLIEVIRITQARFQLDADDVITLKKAGVSETVVKALIEASAVRSPSPSPPPPRAPDHFPTTEAIEDAEHHGEHEPAPQHTARSSRAALLEDGPFSSYAFEETGMGHHLHRALAVRGIPILILRSEAGHHSVTDRAREATGRLNRAVVDRPGGFFVAMGEPDVAVWYRTGASDPPVRILELSRGDVIAYQRRSLGPVSRQRLAAYWAALLSDYTQLFVLGRAPTELTRSHLGETLDRIYEKLRSSSVEETGAPPDETRVILEVLDHMTGEDKEHLLELATRVPAEFGENREVP